MKKVLIIEDNPDNMLLISDILELNGYAIIRAETGLGGLEVLLATRPDFIILDIQLPDISGFEVLGRIRANDSTKQIPVIAMTSYAMLGDKERLLSAGLDGYLEKPIDTDRVMDQIREALGVAP